MEDKRIELVDSLKDWFGEHKIKPQELESGDFLERGIACKLKKARHSRKVALCICDKDEEDSTYEYVTGKKMKPVFVREGDTVDFVKEKILHSFSYFISSDFNEDNSLTERGQEKMKHILELKAMSKEQKAEYRRQKRRAAKKRARERAKLMKAEERKKQQEQLAAARPKRPRIHITRPAAQVPPQPASQPQAEPVKHKRERIHVAPKVHYEKVEPIHKNRNNGER